MNSKLKTARICFLMVVFFGSLIFLPGRAKASSYKGFEYSTKSNGTVCINGYSGKKKSVITPKKIRGKKVTEIAANAFSNNIQIKKLVVSEGVEKVGSMAFFDMQGLKSISLPLTLKRITDDCRIGWYSEASDYSVQTYTVVRGSAACRYVKKHKAGAHIIVKKTGKVVAWFSANGGSGAPAAKVATKGKKYGKLKSLKRTNYKFLGWYTKKKGGKKVTEKMKMTKSRTLYAHWKLTNLAMTLKHRPKVDSGTVTWDCIYFGSYPQTDSTGARKDKIKWRVLSRSGNKALLMADQVLDAKPFSEKGYYRYDSDGNKIKLSDGSYATYDITWGNSTLRSWLNGYTGSYNVRNTNYAADNFIDKAFSAEEKNALRSKTLSNDAYGWDTYSYEDDGGFWNWGVGYTSVGSGEKTKDKVFLLCLEDIRQSYGFYMGSASRVYTLTDYARARLEDLSVTPSFLIRSVYDGRVPLSVNEKGNVNNGTGFEDLAGVRPVIYADLSDNSLWSKAGTVKSNKE